MLCNPTSKQFHVQTRHRHLEWRTKRLAADASLQTVCQPNIKIVGTPSVIDCMCNWIRNEQLYVKRIDSSYREWQYMKHDTNVVIFDNNEMYFR